MPASCAVRSAALQVDVGDDHLGAVLGELQRGGPADAAAGTGDDHQAVLEPGPLVLGAVGAAQGTRLRATLGVVDQLAGAARHGVWVGARQPVTTGQLANGQVGHPALDVGLQRSRHERIPCRRQDLDGDLRCPRSGCGEPGQHVRAVELHAGHPVGHGGGAGAVHQGQRTLGEPGPPDQFRQQRQLEECDVPA